MLERIVEIGRLFDFYGELLTEKQQQAMKLYFFQDLSLSEISERLEISRQAVYDHLHRGEDALRNYEDKMRLLDKYRCIKNETEELDEYIRGKSLNNVIKNELLHRLKNIKRCL